MSSPASSQNLSWSSGSSSPSLRIWMTIRVESSSQFTALHIAFGNSPSSDSRTFWRICSICVTEIPGTSCCLAEIRGRDSSVDSAAGEHADRLTTITITNKILYKYCFSCDLIIIFPLARLWFEIMFDRHVRSVSRFRCAWL